MFHLHIYLTVKYCSSHLFCSALIGGGGGGIIYINEIVIATNVVCYLSHRL